MECRTVTQQIPYRPCSAGLLVKRPVDDACDACADGSSRAHCAGLEGDDERAALEAPTSSRLGGVMQGGELGVPERILIDLASIMTAPDHATIAVEDDCPDGNVVVLDRQDSLGEGKGHPGLIYGVRRKGTQRAASS